jgi:hypothetical protein
LIGFKAFAVPVLFSHLAFIALSGASDHTESPPPRAAPPWTVVHWVEGMAAVAWPVTTPAVRRLLNLTNTNGEIYQNLHKNK